jgi:two-component system sensor histidine kinase/response regulator
VLVTAYGREEVMKEAEDAGLENVLTKPVNASLLFDIAMRVLGGQHGGERAGGSESAAAMEGLAAIQGASVLLVEDNELNQEVAAGLLEGAGFEVDIAQDGREAVEKVRMRGYDIVLMDMQMPVMDGVAATVEIRKDRRYKELPIVAMTANAMQHDREKCLAAGMNGHVAKPIDPDELFNTLLKWIKPKQAQALPAGDGRDGPETAEMPQQAAAERKEVGLPKIPGLDIELGLRRVLGKKAFYLNMLRKYIANQENTPAQIRAALDVGDRAAAERCAHSAKGVNGNIGALGLQALAAGVEETIRNGAGREAVEITLAPFAEALAAMISHLKAAVPPEVSPAVPIEGIDVNRAAEIAGKLADLLAGDDSESTDVLEQHFNLLRMVFGVDAIARIDRAVKQYDFEEALALLKARAQALNISL